MPFQDGVALGLGASCAAMKLPWLVPPVLVVVACSTTFSDPPAAGHRVEATCVACVKGCEALPPQCDKNQVKVFTTPGINLSDTCRRDGMQPWQL